MSHRTRSRDSGKRGAPDRRTHGWLLAAAVVLVGAAGVLAVVALRSSRQPAIGPSPAGSPAASQGTPAIAMTPAAYDLGRISQAKGIVTLEVDLANTGTGDLEITEMETTCGCTKAAVVIDGTAGPWFGMRGHAEWPVGWTARLRPGQQAKLRVQYDPDAHGVYRGPVDRTVFVYSNDPQRARTALRVTGTQIP
jgi:hypothetical protein